MSKGSNRRVENQELLDKNWALWEKNRKEQEERAEMIRLQGTSKCASVGCNKQTTCQGHNQECNSGDKEC